MADSNADQGDCTCTPNDDGWLTGDCPVHGVKAEPIEFVDKRDRGKLWLIRDSGGKADMKRRRSDRQTAWLQWAVSMGWLTANGYLTSEGRMLADSMDHEEFLT